MSNVKYPILFNYDAEFSEGCNITYFGNGDKIEKDILKIAILGRKEVLFGGTKKGVNINNVIFGSSFDGAELLITKNNIYMTPEIFCEQVNFNDKEFRKIKLTRNIAINGLTILSKRALDAQKNHTALCVSLEELYNG